MTRPVKTSFKLSVNSLPTSENESFFVAVVIVVESNGFVKTAVVLVLLVILLIGGCRFLRRTPRSAAPSHFPEQPVTPGPSPIATTPTLPLVEPRATPKPPSYEEWFIQSVRQYEGPLPADVDEARIAYNRAERARGISNSLPGIRTLSGWSGILRKVQPTVDGRLAIAIELPGTNILLQTWSDPISDVRAGTLIEQKAALYSRLRGLAIGTPVSFDFEFLEDKDDWVKEGSKTVREGMTSPKFIVRFTDVKSF